METIQQQIGAMQEEIKRLREELKEVKKGNFDTIACKTWKVVDADGKTRIAAATLADGQAFVQLLDKDEKTRIEAVTTDSGIAVVLWRDKDEKMRIAAGTFNDLLFHLPTKDLNSPKEP